MATMKLGFASAPAQQGGPTSTSAGRRVMATLHIAFANVSAATFIELAIEDMPSPAETRRTLRRSAPVVPVPALLAHLRLSPSLVIFSQSSSCMVVRHLEYQIDWILYLIIVFVIFVGVRLRNRHLTHCRLERWLERGCDDMRDED